MNHAGPRAPKAYPDKKWPWFLFCFLVISNALLSYGPFSLGHKALILLVGILFPLCFFIWNRPLRARIADDFFKTHEFLPDFPAWGLALVLGLALFIRFYKLTGLFVWPTLDESQLGMFAIHLSEKWNWKFFYTFGQVPPLPIWAAALLLKSGFSTLFSLWFPSAVVSSLTIFAFFAATRQFFSRSLALLCAGIWAFGYWPFLLGRFCHEGIWLPLWACFCGYFLGRFFKSRTEGGKKWNLLILGFVTGLGSFTFTPWPFLVLAILWALFGPPFSKSARNFRYILYFAVGALPALGPFLWAVWTEGYGQHVSAMFALSGWFSLQRQILTVISYFTELFWGTLENDSTYTAAFGGMLNPLWASLFFIGLLQMIRSRALPLVQWIFLAFLLVLLPGLLSMNVETFRVALALPFIYLITALGAGRLLRTVPSTWRWPLLLVLLILGAGTDGVRVLQSQVNPLEHPDVSTTGSFPMANLRAQKILGDLDKRLGPGLIFTEFNESPSDQSLFDLTYSFNAAENKKLRGRAQWGGVVTNASYYPLLHPRFPGSVWYQLGRSNPEDPEMVLGTFPINEKNLPTLRRWVSAHHYFSDLSWKTNSISENQTYRAADLLFSQKPSEIEKDPFLGASYWDRRAEFYYRYDFQKHFPDLVNSLQLAIQKYPSGYLCYKLVSLWIRKGQYEKARDVLEKGLRSNPGNNDLLSALSLLNKLEVKPSVGK